VADLPELELLSESVSDQPSDGVVALPQLATLVSSDDGLRLEHPLSGQPQWMWDRPDGLHAAAQIDGLGLVAATREDVLVGQGLLAVGGFDVDGVTHVLAAGDGALLSDGEQTWLYRAGALNSVNLSPPFAARGDGTLYGMDGGHRVELVRSGVSWAELDRQRAPATDLGVDGVGALWWIDGRTLVRLLDDVEDAWTLPRKGVALHLSADTAGGWVVDKDGAWWRLDTEPVGWADADPAAVGDAQGRLLVADDQGVGALSWGRPLGLWGLSPGEALVGDTPLVAVPVLGTQVDQVEWSVDGNVLELEGTEVVLDPLPWQDGAAHTLAVAVSYDDGETAAIERTFRVEDVGSATWADDVEPIYAANCALCHDNGTETVLATSEQWESEIDLILTNVATGAMPLAQTPLTGAQIAAIRAWRDGGFE
jgi:hypothetical protein